MAAGKSEKEKGKKERKLCSPKAGFIFSATRMNTREGEEENNK